MRLILIRHGETDWNVENVIRTMELPNTYWEEIDLPDGSKLHPVQE